MRTYKRIAPFLNKIGTQWEIKCPDWRFGQLIMNFLSWCGEDPFYWEEDKFLEKFNEFMEYGESTKLP